MIISRDQWIVVNFPLNRAACRHGVKYIEMYLNTNTNTFEGFKYNYKYKYF